MAEKKIVVPAGMRAAAGAAIREIDPECYIVYLALEAALRWLSENPIVPTREQEWGLHGAWCKSDKPQSEAGGDISSQIRFSVIEWQRQMFLAPEPEAPSMEEQKAVYDIVAKYVENNGGHWRNKDWDVPMELAVEAFRRGKQVSR